MLEAVQPYIKYFARTGGLLAKVFAVLLSIYGLKEIWYHQESKHYSNTFKINLSLLYLLHVASVSLAIAVLCGYASVGAPIAAAFVSATALLKCGFDLFKDNIRHYRLKKELAGARIELAQQYDIFNKHLDEYNLQHQSYFASAYQFIGRQFNQFFDFCKKLSFSPEKNEEENLQQLNELSNGLKKCQESNLKDVDLLADDLEKIIITSQKIIDLQNAIALMNYDLDSKRYIMQFSGISASLTLLLCFPFNWYAADILNPVMLGIGIASALTNVWGIYQKYFLEHKFIADTNKEIHHLIKDSVATVEKLNVEKARHALNQKLDTLVEDFDKKPTQAKVIPVIFSSKLPPQYQAPTSPGLAQYIKENREEEGKQQPKSWWGSLRSSF